MLVVKPPLPTPTDPVRLPRFVPVEEKPVDAVVVDPLFVPP